MTDPINKFLTSVLGEPWVSKEPKAKPNSIQQTLDRLVPNLDLTAQQVIPPSNLTADGPFTEISIPNELIPCIATANITSIPDAPHFSIAGEFIYIRSYGNSPRARYTINLGGKLHTLMPGDKIVAKFSSFVVENRQFIIQSDWQGPLEDPHNEGSLNLIIGKTTDVAFDSPDALVTDPYFNPIDILGINPAIQRNASIEPWVAFNSGDIASTSSAGCTHLRAYISNIDPPDGTHVKTLVAGDIVTIELFEVLAGFTNNQIYMISGSLPLARVKEPLNTKSYTWGVGDIITVLDFDITHTSEILQVKVSNSNGHSQWVYIQGVA